jgi:hypothetical protein
VFLIQFWVFDPMMKTAIFAFALTLPVLTSLVTPASAQYTCEQVRAFVAENGLAQARARARAAGMTPAQEREAAKCLRRGGSVRSSKRRRASRI